MMTPRSHSEAGMTFVEVAVSMAILSVIMLMTLLFVNRMSDAAATEASLTEMQISAAKLVNNLITELRSGNLPGAASLNSSGFESFVVRVPVDHDEDGDVFNDTMAVDWGYPRPDVAAAETLNCSATYRFTVATTFSEATRNVDLNRDGDRTDEYDVGRIEKLIAPAGSQGQLILGQTGDFVVRRKSVVVGDIDNDGINDPIFRLTNNQLEVTLFMANTTIEEPILIKSTTVIDLRNL